jgi:hypothetical protein
MEGSSGSGWQRCSAALLAEIISSAARPRFYRSTDVLSTDIITFHADISVWVELFHADRRRDAAKLIVGVYSCFATAPNMGGHELDLSGFS